MPDGPKSKATNESSQSVPRAKRNPTNKILMAAQTFILDAEALQEILEVSKPALAAKQTERKAELKKLLSDVAADDQDRIKFDHRQLHRLLGLFSKLIRGAFLFRGHLLVALVSRFDAFVAEVARELLLVFPDRLGKKSITYAEAAKFGSIKELQEKIIEDEVDQRMRESHKEQIEFLSSLANVPLGSDEPELLKRFVELTERRNCHIHFNGRVSPQYRRVCSGCGVKLDPALKDGARLNVTINYFRSARRVLSELAFKIAQTVVRKNFDKSQGTAEMHLNVIGLAFLNQHRWTEALMVFDYAANLRGNWAGSESDRRNNIINKAQALIGLEKTEEAMRVIDSGDWSASHPKYLMAIHLLKREFSEAEKLMPTADFSESDYRDLPIFESFRQTEQFKSGFLALFRHDFDRTALDAVTEALAEIETQGGAVSPPSEVTPEPKQGEVLSPEEALSPEIDSDVEAVS
jgi:hypothetical protein